MIQRITYNRPVDLTKVKLNIPKLNEVCDELDRDKEIYYIGIDFAPKGSKEYSFMSVLTKNNDEFHFVKSVQLSN